jgi:hypothetical protein
MVGSEVLLIKKNKQRGNITPTKEKNETKQQSFYL